MPLGLTVQAVNKYFPEADATQKGHMRHQCKGLQSTKVSTQAANVLEEEEQSLDAQLQELKKKQRDIYVSNWNYTDIVYTDQMGKFPHRLSRGNKYIMVMYYIDGSTILVEPMKSSKEKEMIRANSILIHFCANETNSWHEISKAYKAAIEEHGLKAERVPKESHQQSSAEKAI